MVDAFTLTNIYCVRLDGNGLNHEHLNLGHLYLIMPNF